MEAYNLNAAQGEQGTPAKNLENPLEAVHAMLPSTLATREQWVFGGVDTEPNEAHVLVIGIPLEATVSYKPGTRFGPEAIRRAAANIEFYSLRAGIDVEEIKIHDLGDIPVSSNLQESLARIAEAARRLSAYTRDKLVVFLGGEHTVTYGIVRGLATGQTGGRTCLLTIDAHLDLREEYLGDPWSHASVMRRISEAGLVESIAFYGVRAFTRAELDYAEGQGYPVYTPRVDPLEVSRGIADWIARNRCQHLHVSIDVDAYDPAYAPGVGNPEPEGLTPGQVFDFLHEVMKAAASLGVTTSTDIVEVSPPNDCNDITSVLAAKTVVEMIAGWYTAKTPGAKRLGTS